MSQLVIGAEHAVRAPGPSTALHQIRAVAGIAPDAVAMRCGDRSTSYRELLSRAGIVAASLGQLGGVRSGTVGVCAGRGPEFVAGCLGAWLAGASYLPLDPEHPTARRELLLRDAGAAALLTMPELAVATDVPLLAFDELDTAGDTAHEAPASPGDLAYVMYTSGSTGTPKGVAVSHAALADLIRWHHGAFGITAADRVSVVAGVGFDASAWEIWGALSAGASLHVPPERARLVPALLRDWLLAEAVTVTWAPTVLIEQLIALPWPDSAALRVLLTGGERLRRRPPAGLPFALVNSYGPTECTVVATYGVMEPGGEDLPDIGRPRPGLRAAVLDAGADPVPDGEPGELYLGGTGVAREYLGRPTLTAAAFVPDPDGPPGTRRYRTGDVVRRTADGRLHFIGRLDGQVKVRGNRIELGEVEAALLRHPGVAAAVVRPYAGPGGTRLVAFVVPAGGQLPTTAQLRRHLRRHLPEPFVLQVIMLLDALPMAPNSKVDVARLPEPDHDGLRGPRLVRGRDGRRIRRPRSGGHRRLCRPARPDGAATARGGPAMIPAAVEQPPAPLRLDANEPADSGLDLAALVASAAGTLHRYPVAPSRLTDAIAARHAVPADRVLLGAGSADLITLAWRVCTGPGRTAAFGTPGFELYALLCRQFGLPARTWPVATPSDVLPGDVVFDGPAVGLVAVSNPHNPTGSRVRRTAVARLADRLPAGAVLLNDEAYAEYVEDEPGDVTFAELSGRPNVISTRTFSKLYGLPALRVGYAVAAPALIRRLAALRTPHMVSQLGALGALQALRDDAAVAARRQRTASCRGRLRAELLRRGFTVPDACANFLLAHRDDDIDWAARLAAHGVLVKAVGPAIRITVPALADLDRLLGALDAVSRGKA